MSDDEGFDLSYLNEISTMAAPTNSKKPTSGGSSKKAPSKVGPDKAAIRAVLDKKKDGEKQKADEYKKNRENLLALRSKDRKSYKRMNAMITRTKGYSKSVIEDAKDISTACGEQQCDEDDYGYESQMSQSIFDKLSNQYSQMPEDDRLKIKSKKAGDIGDIKSRVMSSLKKQEEEESGPRKRKRRNDSDEGDDFINDGDPYKKHSKKEEYGDRKEERRSEHKLPLDINYTNHKTKDNEAFKYDKTKETEKEKKKKPQRPQPPSLNFAELLKLAQTKEATKSGAKVEEMIKEKVKEKEEAIKKKNERPLTAKEKEMQEDERLRKLRRAGKLPNLPLDKLKEYIKKKEAKKCDNNNAESVDKKKENSKACDSKSNDNSNKKTLEKKSEPPPPPPKVKDRSKYFALPFSNSSNSSSSVKNKAESSAPKKLDPPKKNLDKQVSKPPPSKPKPPPVKPRELPSANVKRFNPKKMMEKQKSRYGSRIDSDSEYDSEMDDFIDDGDDGLDEVSAAIQQIYGYNKNKYKDEDDDLDDMEVGFSQVEKEEKKSAKLGALEDLEDMRQEEEERKAKLRKKKLLEKRKK